MSRRFQFSLHRLLLATALLALATWLLRQWDADRELWAILLFPAALASAFGQLFGRPILGAFVVVGAEVLVMYVFLAMSNEFGIFFLTGSLGCGMTLVYFIIEDRLRTQRLARREAGKTAPIEKPSREYVPCRRPPTRRSPPQR